MKYTRWGTYGTLGTDESGNAPPSPEREPGVDQGLAAERSTYDTTPARGPKEAGNSHVCDDSYCEGHGRHEYNPDLCPMYAFPESEYLRQKAEAKAWTESIPIRARFLAACWLYRLADRVHPYGFREMGP